MSDDGVRKYYEDKAAEAAALEDLVREAELRCAPKPEMDRLQRLLEQARYVGD